MEGSRSRDDIEGSRGHPLRGRTPHDRHLKVDEDPDRSSRRPSRLLSGYLIASTVIFVLLVLAGIAALVTLVT